MSDALAAVQDRTFAHATQDPVPVRDASHQPWATLVIDHGERGEWAGTWLRVRAERVISYPAEGAV